MLDSYCMLNVTIFITYHFTADVDTDYRNLSTPITSMVGSNTVSGSVTIINDNTNEDTEMFTIHIDNCSNSVAVCTPSLMNTTLTIAINDDDCM